MCLVVMIVFIEATGMFLALGAMTGRKVDAEDVKRGLRADSLGRTFLHGKRRAELDPIIAALAGH
jgi:xanthine/uracil permease